MYKYVVEIKDHHNRIIESVETNNRFYAKWVYDTETKEQGYKCEILELDKSENYYNVIL